MALQNARPHIWGLEDVVLSPGAVVFPGRSLLAPQRSSGGIEAQLYTDPTTAESPVEMCWDVLRWEVICTGAQWSGHNAERCWFLPPLLPPEAPECPQPVMPAGLFQQPGGGEGEYKLCIQGFVGDQRATSGGDLGRCCCV